MDWLAHPALWTSLPALTQLGLAVLVGLLLFSAFRLEKRVSLLERSNLGVTAAVDPSVDHAAKLRSVPSGGIDATANGDDAS